MSQEIDDQWDRSEIWLMQFRQSDIQSRGRQENEKNDINRYIQKYYSICIYYIKKIFNSSFVFIIYTSIDALIISPYNMTLTAFQPAMQNTEILNTIYQHILTYLQD